ncbi:unnamed protein product [Dovyalis caffra]|uniref:Uncharacterized protein n=1 Tax=Dovyalis caffra TaxID=77055 RepID=A0AAV1RFN6_9ROSI|nr:unnamed protein product [Dovyalis caffra]
MAGLNLFFRSWIAKTRIWLLQERIRPSEDKMMRRFIMRRIEEKVDMASIAIEKHDKTILRQLLLCLNLSFEISNCGTVVQLNVEEGTCQNLHYHFHCKAKRFLFVSDQSERNRDRDLDNNVLHEMRSPSLLSR